MPVRDTANIKLIIRITDSEQMSDQAKKFMNKRLMIDNNDGDIWVLQSPTAVETAAIKSLGFEFFQKSDHTPAHSLVRAIRESCFSDGLREFRARGSFIS